jgi:phospholipid transport system substrate-binding protein
MKMALKYSISNSAKMAALFKSVVVLCLLVISYSTYADQENTVVHLQDMVAKNSQEMVKLLDQERPYFTTDPERFYHVMDEKLSQLFDFERFTLRVMGRFARGSDTEQRHRFLTAFKESLFKAYAKALVDSGKFQIKVTSAEMISRDDDRAMVNLVIISDSGNQYPVTYFMYKNKDSQTWLIENIIVSGVNIGLAFRDRFEQEMRTNNNDMNKVIAGWNDKAVRGIVKKK